MRNTTNTTLCLTKAWIALVFLFFFDFSVSSQELLTGTSMESSAGWTIYNEGSANPATYQFNYTASKPFDGKGGCLRVTSAKKTNILFWQKVTLKAGRKYKADLAVKTNYVVNYWCELFLSTVAPVEGQDYNPSGGLFLGLSTWVGCGPYLDGLLSIVGCNGSRSFVPAGTLDTDVSVYFGIKTGIYNDMTTTMEALIDEPTLKLVNDAALISASEGTIDQANLKITGVSPTIKASTFRAGLKGWASSTIDILGKKSNKALRLTLLDSIMVSDTLLVKVTGTSVSSVYSIEMRSLSSSNNITATTLGTLDAINSKITSIPVNVRVAQLLSAITVSPNATAKIMLNGAEASGETVVTSAMSIVVTSENGAAKTYTITTGTAMSVQAVSNISSTVASINNTIYEVSGSSVIHITNSTNPFNGSIINLKSEDVWLYFDNIKPQVVNDKYLKQILVNGNVSVVGTNLRLVEYLQGSVIISHPSTITPLTIYSAANLAGSQLTIGVNTYNRVAELGTMNDNIVSFKLKKGYMVTFSADESGTGYSRVYVAADGDITVNQLPVGLSGKVSFVRVLPWRWTTKKGWCGGSDVSTDILNCSWRYDWDNYANSTLNAEYVPMRHGRWWNSYANIDNKLNSNNALGFNEPDRPDQANMPVQEAIDLWPNLLKSGLRIGSPCPSDGGIPWLFSFMQKCDSLNYRVDFVALHWYMGGQTARQFYDRLKWIHDVTKRPIWITEWNNGANWTCCKPTYESQANTIAQFMHMLDTTSFVERYSIYEWVEDTRQMFYSGSSILTPAGEVYRDKVSPMSFNSGKVYYPPFLDMLAPSVPSSLTASNITSTGCNLTWLASADNGSIAGYQILQNGTVISTTTGTSFVISTLSPSTTYSFTVKAYDIAGNYSAASQATSVTTLASAVPPAAEVPTAGKVYKITAKHSGKSLSMRGGATATGNSVYLTQNTYVAGTYQQFKVEANGSYFRITPQHATTKALDVSGASTSNGAQVLQYTYGSTKTNQQWSFVSVGGGYYQIKCRNSGKCMYVENASIGDDILVKQTTCSATATNQHFTFSTSLLKSAGIVPIEMIADEISEVVFYPNPFAGSITMNVKNMSLQSAKVININGSLVKSFSASELVGNTLEFGKELSIGIYFVVLTDNVSAKAYKIVKQ